MNTIFLIGSPDSPYIMNFIEYVLEPLKFEIFMQFRVSDYKKEVGDFYNIHKINIIDSINRNDKKIYRIPKLGSLLLLFSNLLKIHSLRRFDFIHIHFVGTWELLKALLIKGKNTQLVATFWGDDLLRTSDKRLKINYFLFNKRFKISSDSYTLERKYKDVFPQAKQPMSVIYFGASLLNYIDNCKLSKTECKEYFSFPKNKKIIAIGYNAIKEQQHDKILNELLKVKNKIEFFLVFQMTYGYVADKEYQPYLLKIIEESGFEYKIITDYLIMDDLAKLRIATDIFINAQTTDAFCNSIKEYMYAKTQIISGSWLHYPEIDMFPLYINEFSDFNEIPVLLNTQISEEKLKWNKNIIKEKSTWDACRTKWSELYGVNNRKYRK